MIAQDYKILTREDFDLQYKIEDFELENTVCSNRTITLGYSNKDSLFAIVSSFLTFHKFAGKDYIYITQSKDLIEKWSKNCDFPDIPAPKPYLYFVKDKIIDVKKNISFFEEEFLNLVGFKFELDSINGEFIDKLDKILQKEIYSYLKKNIKNRDDISNLKILHTSTILLQECMRRKVNGKWNYSIYRYYGFKPIYIPTISHKRLKIFKEGYFYKIIHLYFFSKFKNPRMTQDLKGELIDFLNKSTSYKNNNLYLNDSLDFNELWNLEIDY